ncbi:transcription elongation factor Spt5 [Mycena belliarum]|uniref:Transcription elongation factor SPT5 n=2 Tax=Agaricomycetidae TaxID=452333 RepID=A0AAD6TZ00_9AGAR|nr:transcription elongation factor Spt5 [Mycena belliae]
MSDLEEDPYTNPDDPYSQQHARTDERHGKHRHDSEEDEEDEDREEEDEDDEDDEEESPRKKKKRRHKKDIAARFLDLDAAESDDDDDGDDGGEDDGQDGFIEDPDDADEASRRQYPHLPNVHKFADADEQSPEQIANDLRRRWQTQHAGGRFTEETMNDVPQRLLMPSVHDASLWQVRVKVGRERDLVFSLMRKAIDVEYSARPLAILSAFQRDSLPGMIYVEASSSQQVSLACNGLVGVYLSRGIQLVPIEEMASLLQIKKQDLTVTPNSWVRIKRGTYQGDLAQVVDITETGEYVGVKFIPRIDLNPRDDGSLEGPTGKKRKKTNIAGSGTARPPQRLFNYEEVVGVWGRKNVVKRNQAYVFQNETYKDGFIEKDLKLSQLTLEDVDPTLEEITQFARRQDGGESGETVMDLSIIAEASRKAAISVLQPGDHIEVFEGEQSGVHGVVEEINQDVVTITAVGVDFDGQKVDLPARSVRKRFKAGDHVKVMTGQNADETGLVVSVSENVVTFLSDMSMQEVSVFSKDLREAAEVGSGTNIVGNYELHDLVQLDLQTVGVIFKTERDSFRVLDQNGQVRLVQPHQISMRRDSHRAVATDSEGHELRINDNMKEIDGEARKGRVLHIHQAFFAFLHNRDITENGGVFVTRARSLVSLAPKGNLAKGPGASMDLSKMNPALMPPTGGMVGSGNMGRGPRDRLIGVTVTIVKGPYKGYVGAIKDTNGPSARVELHTGNKVVAVDKEKLKRRLESGKLVDLEGYFPMPGLGDNSGGSMQSRYSSNFGAKPPLPGPTGPTPGWNGGRTPAWDSGRTPAWNANSSRTPNPYGQGADGKTPAWSTSSKTPNPYAAGGRTPAWNTASSSTPNPYANGDSAQGYGGATPGRPAWGGGGATPARSAPRPEVGWASSPARPWTDSTWNAPTPAVAAPTPGFNGAPTPAAAPTPGFIAATPAGAFVLHGSGMSAPTPGAMSAPTPGVSYPSYNQFQVPIEYEPPEAWLLDPAYRNYLTRIKVRVQGTRTAHPQYLDGEYEGQEAQVMAATQTASLLEQTAMLKFGDGTTRTGFLVKYLLPVEPRLEGEEVLVLDDPKHKGLVVRLREPPDGDSRRLVTVSPVKSTDVFELTRDRLALLRIEG